MRKHIVTLSVVALMLSMLLVVTGCGESVSRGLSPNQKALLSLLPAEANTVLTINFQKLAGLKLFEKQVEKFATKKENSMSGPFSVYQEFIDKLGIDFKKDLIALGFAGKGKMGLTPDMNGEGVLLAQLNYDKTAAMNIIKEAGAALTQGTHEGVTFYSAPIAAEKEIALAFIGDQSVVVGTPNEVKTVIELSQGKGKSVLENPKFKPHYAKLRTDSVGSAIIAIPEENKKTVDTGMIKMDMSKAEAVIFNIDYTGSAYAGELILISHNEEANRTLVTTIEGLKGFAAALGAEVEEIVNNIHFKADAHSVTADFNITNSMIEKLQKKIEEKKAAGSGGMF